MTSGTEKTGPENNVSGAAEVSYLDYVAEANRSLTVRGMWTVLFWLGAFNLAVAVFLFSVGAYPAPIFLGMDMGAVYLAFHLMEQKRLAASERILVSSNRVEVLKRIGGREQCVWRSFPQFTRIESDETDPDLPKIWIKSKNQSIVVGSVMGADRRRQLMVDLQCAIAASRNERHVIDAIPAQEAGGATGLPPV